jgi:hypothetical protein
MAAESPNNYPVRHNPVPYSGNSSDNNTGNTSRYTSSGLTESKNDIVVDSSRDSMFLDLVRHSSKVLDRLTPSDGSDALAELVYARVAIAYAEALPPLRDRDLKALSELFQTTQMELIEADILENLAWRYPEPCWEDELFTFLEGYL